MMAKAWMMGDDGFKWHRMLMLLALLAGSHGVATAATDPDFAAEEMVWIPAGPFIMGSDRVDTAPRQSSEHGVGKPLYLDEHPRHTLTLPGFYIDRFEVSYARYRDFVIQTNYWLPQVFTDSGYLLSPAVLVLADDAALRRLAVGTFRVDRDVRRMDREALLAVIDQQRQGLDALPITGVGWREADAYCRWRDKRLPSEVEWEKAARGEAGREFPWGDHWSPERANTGAMAVDDERDPGVRPVGSHPQGVSVYGVHDMAGNVMEWVADWYRPYAGSDHQTDDFGLRFRVVRGGGWGGIGHYALRHYYRAAYRFYLRPDSAYSDLGFRCAMDVG